jgi:hypothetical protein
MSKNSKKKLIDPTKILKSADKYAPKKKKGSIK